MVEVNTSQNNDSQTGGIGQVEQEPARSDKRFTDLTDKLSEQERKHAVEMEEKETARQKAEADAKQARFEADLLRETMTYPQAKNYEKDIKSYTEKGLSVAEATKLVLANKNELSTGEDQTRENIGAKSLGGSSVNAGGGGLKTAESMTQAERRAELVRLEGTGELQQTLKKGLSISGE